MTVIHRRLFWKIYLTLLTSLVAVAVLMGSLWWVFGESPRERWGAFRLQLTDELVPARDNPPGAVDGAVRRLGTEIGADISVYRSTGDLIAAYGPAISLLSGEDGPRHVMRIDLPDGRTVLARMRPPPRERGMRIITTMLIVACGVGLAAYPMTARLTRQLEGLRIGMARWGAGELSARVDDTGNDEVALVGRTFNTAADRITTLLTAQRALLANASHELRSPLARLRIATDLWFRRPEAESQAEILRNLAEVDQLVEEILLSSRLDHPGSSVGPVEVIDLLGLAAEEAARIGAGVEGVSVGFEGNETLLRRMLRNMLDNGMKHGVPPVRVMVSAEPGEAQIIVSDEGQGIPPAERDRVFEAFYRPAGRSESGGGWGLGLALVRQIASRHGGTVKCESVEGSGSRFVVRLPIRQAGHDPRTTHSLQ